MFLNKYFSAKCLVKKVEETYVSKWEKKRQEFIARIRKIEKQMEIDKLAKLNFKREKIKKKLMSRPFFANLTEEDYNTISISLEPANNQLESLKQNYILIFVKKLIFHTR